MRLLSWNCRGLKNPFAIQSLHHLVKSQRPEVLFLMETKLNAEQVEWIRVKTGFRNVFTVPCHGRSGRLALLWREGVHLEIFFFF